MNEAGSNEAIGPAAGSLSKSEAAAPELSELFFACNAEERRLILLNLPYAPIVPTGPIDAAVAQSVIPQPEAAVLAHQPERFAREFGRALSISRTQALRLTAIRAASRWWSQPRHCACRPRCCNGSFCTSTPSSAGRCNASTT